MVKKDTNEKYHIIQEYTKSIIRGYNKSLILTGAPGLGKTYTVREILQSQKAKFLENRGINTPLALFRFLYANNKENLILLFDDTSSLINNPESYVLLLNVLWEGIAEWNTSRRLKIPSKFEFKGKIILITNSLDSLHADTIKSRCLVYNLALNHEEIIQKMQEIADKPSKDLTKQERMDIVEFLQARADESTFNFDLRTQDKVEKLYLYDKVHWKALAEPLLTKNAEMELLISCIKTTNSVNRAQKIWSKQTGCSRSKFFRMRRCIEQR